MGLLREWYDLAAWPEAEAAPVEAALAAARAAARAESAGCGAQQPAAQAEPQAAGQGPAGQQREQQPCGPPGLLSHAPPESLRALRGRLQAMLAAELCGCAP